MTPQRGAIAITLDKPRSLFFDAAATYLLVERYGRGVAAKLYKVELLQDGSANFEMVSSEVFEYALWAGLQADAAAQGDALTLEQVASFIRPWTFNLLFTAVIRAFLGANETPPAPPGNALAAETPASPAAKKKATRKPAKTTKVSTLKTRSGLRLLR